MTEAAISAAGPRPKLLALQLVETDTPLKPVGYIPQAAPEVRRRGFGFSLGQAEGRDSRCNCPGGVLGAEPLRGTERCHGAGLWELLLMPVLARSLKPIPLCIAAASAVGVEQTP